MIKRDDFNFEIVNFSFPNVYVPRSPSYYIVFRSLLVFQECVLLVLTATTETNFRLLM